MRVTPAGACAVAVAVACGAAPAGQQATFSSRLEAVRVDALVTERGRHVTGLTAADFEVVDNGVRQSLDLVSFETLPLDVVLVFDLSASVKGERLEQLHAAAKAVLGGLTARDQAALLSFNHRVQLQQALTGDMRAVGDALAVVEPRGETALFDGTYAGLLIGARDAARTLVVVFSDGVDTASWLSASQVLDAAKRTDAVVYALSARGSGSAPFLRDLADQTGGSAIEVESLRELSARLLTILEEFRHRYLLSYSPQGVTTAGWHRLEVRVKGRRGVAVRARAGYTGR